MSVSSLGKWMIVIAWIFILGLLTMYFADWEKQQFNPNREPDSRITTMGERRVVLEQNRFNHYVVTGSINDYQVQFMLDTGATVVAVPDRLAQHLQLPYGPQGVADTANGRVRVYATTIDILRIGDIALYNVPASIMPGSSSDNIVLLGMSALRDLDFIQQGRTLTLIQK